MVGGSVHLSTTPKEANMQDESKPVEFTPFETLAIRCFECFKDSTRVWNRMYCSPECVIVHQGMIEIRENF